MRAFYATCLTGVLMSACAPKTTQATEPVSAPSAPMAAATANPIPGETMAEAFPDCEWGEVTGAGLSIWTYTCPNMRLVADDALPGFQREFTDPAGAVTRTPVIQIFTKPESAPINAILDAVRAASPGAEACVIEPGSHGDHVLMPTGDALIAYEKSFNGETEGPSQPCGPLGPSEVGGRTFRLVDGAPDKVAMINWGSEITQFDADTLRAVMTP
jgi:hypothetical protein